MNPVEFTEQTVIIAKDQLEYMPLPAYKFNGDPTGRTVFCWKLSLKERFKLLFSGLIWHQVLTFNNPLQPQLLDINKPDYMS